MGQTNRNATHFDAGHHNSYCYFFLFFQPEFASFKYALVKTLIMTNGEFDYSSIFHDDKGPVPFPFMTYLLFVFFFIIMSIIIINLLVGLTVDDIKGFLDNAALTKIAMMVNDTALRITINVLVNQFLFS